MRSNGLSEVPRNAGWAGSRFELLVVIAIAACFPRHPAPRPGDVGIRNVELTQGVQALNQVPLLANKPTFARVYLLGNTSGGTVVPTISATMTIDGSGAIAPTGTRVLTPPATGSNARTFNDSFLFTIPTVFLAAGRHHLRVELIVPAGVSVSDPNNLVSEFDFTIRNAVTRTIYGIRYGYTNVPPKYQQQLGLTS